MKVFQGTGAEAALTRAAGWHLSPKSPAAWMLRDALLPLLWIGGWLWLVIEWIVLLAQRRSAVRAAGAWPGPAAQAHPGGRDA